MTLTPRQFLRILAIFVLTRAALTAVGAAAVLRLPATQGAEYTHLLDGNPALDMWYRWDAGFYATIATEGYDWRNERRPSDDMAFLPLYPLAMRAVLPLTAPFSPYLSTQATIAGLLVSNAALLAATIVLFDLARRFADTDTAWRAVWLLMLSPGSIYLSGVYTEGLFLLLSLLTFRWLSRDRFVPAVLAASLACLTRSVGVALVPALLWYAAVPPDARSIRLREQKPAEVGWNRTNRLLKTMFALFPALVFAAYILFAGMTAGDPLAYFGAYSGTWGRTTSTPIEAFTVYFSGQDVSFFGWKYSWIDLAATIGYLALAVVVLRRKVEWGVFALSALLIPIATGSLLSMPRFGTVIFPFYLFLALWAKRRRQMALLYGISAALMLFVTLRFVTWRWIA